MTEQEPPDGLAQRLRAARQWAGITQEQLAGLSTVSVRAIRDLEQGRVRHPRRETLRLLADAMRLGDARRAALELAVEGAAPGSVMREAYGAELAPPPLPLHALVGRSEELRSLIGLLSAEHERLLSVVGLAGVGKSRLAQEAALLLHGRERTPVVWVDMTQDAEPPAAAGGSRSAHSALSGWARSLAESGGGLEELASVIGDRPTLLVLDGHDRVPRLTPRLLDLLHACERLKVLITAREAHDVPAGRLLPLGPLPVPGPTAFAGPPTPGQSLTVGQPAVELMLAYVAHHRPDLLPTDSLVRTVTGICQALDGVPRAMEAAASWLLLYSPEELLRVARTSPLELVDDATLTDPGREGLAAPLAAAVDRLGDGRAALLGDLGALSDGWSAHQAAVALSGEPAFVVREVHALMLRGLVRRLPATQDGTPRFGVLNLVRRRAAQRTTDGARAAAPVH